MQNVICKSATTTPNSLHRDCYAAASPRHSLSKRQLGPGETADRTDSPFIRLHDSNEFLCSQPAVTVETSKMGLEENC